MDYNQYAHVRDLCWNILIDQNIARLPIKISQICSAMDVTVCTYMQAAEVIRILGLTETCHMSDDLSFARDRELYILYNNDRPLQRIRFTIAHELGHCLMHNDRMASARPLTRINVCRDFSIAEQQANTFAANLLAPACVLWGLGLTTAKEIAEYCDISVEASRVRLARLRILENRNRDFLKVYGHGCFLQSPLERQVYKQFQSYIDTEKANRKKTSVAFLDLPTR